MPKAFPAAMMVTLKDLVDVMFWGSVFVIHTLFGGLCSVETPDSQTLKMFWGLSLTLWLVNIVLSSYNNCPEYLAMQTLP